MGLSWLGWWYKKQTVTNRVGTKIIQNRFETISQTKTFSMVENMFTAVDKQQFTIKGHKTNFKNIELQHFNSLFSITETETLQQAK